MVNLAEDMSVQLENPNLTVGRLRQMHRRLQYSVSHYQAAMARGRRGTDYGYESDY